MGGEVVSLLRPSHTHPRPLSKINKYNNAPLYFFASSGHVARRGGRKGRRESCVSQFMLTLPRWGVGKKEAVATPLLPEYLRPLSSLASRQDVLSPASRPTQGRRLSHEAFPHLYLDVRAVALVALYFWVWNASARLRQIVWSIE